MIPDSTAFFTATELLVRAGRFDLAIAEFQRFVRERPDDWATANMVADLLLRAGDTAATESRCSEALAYLSIVADWRVARGDERNASKLRARIDDLELADMEAQLELARGPEIRDRASRARACVANGDAVGASEHLTAEMADGDPSLLLTIAEIQLRGGKLDRGIALMERVMSDDPSLAEDVARLGIEMAPRQPDAGFLLVEMAANVWTERSQWYAAAEVFEDFAAKAPDYAPALVRLHEIEAAAFEPPDEKSVILPFRPIEASSQ